MKFSEIASRITGFSTPIFGLQWEAPTADVAVAREVIIFLEDRRVLFSPYAAEVPDHVLQSILEIRRVMTEILRRGGIAGELVDSLAAMRTACRKFIDAMDGGRGRLIRVSPGDMHGGGTTSWIFNQNLGELRGVFGLLIAQIAVRYRIDVGDELSTILPLDPADDME
jgi:uncharacterized protein DUF6650